MNYWKFAMVPALFAAALPLGAAEAADPAPISQAAEALFTINNIWILIGGMLVFLMHLGFATVESGLCRTKNCTNILFKNTLVPAIGFLTYAVAGFSLMYPGEANWLIGKVFGFAGFGMGNDTMALMTGTADPAKVMAEAAAYNGGKFTYWSDFFFQGMFAATAATIVSGAVAERIKVNAFLVFTLIYVMFVYPVLGSWGWGGGWLADLGFHDFAGSTFVHSVGGWAALAGVILLGPRIGKYSGSHVIALPGHSMPLATIGVFCLWLGWFGFNGGSVLSADPTKISFDDLPAQAGSLDDAQRLSGRSGGDHRRCRLRESALLDPHRSGRRCDRGSFGADLRPAAARRPGRGQRNLGNSGGRHLRAAGLRIHLPESVDRRGLGRCGGVPVRLADLLGDPEDDGHPGERGRGAARPRPRRTRHGGLSGIPVLPQSVV